MIRFTRNLALCCVLSLPALADPLTDAQACTGIAGRLERLACFDAAFATPFTVEQGGDNAQAGTDPHTVSLALASEAARGEQLGFIGANDPSATDFRYTAAALGALPPRPIMMLSCVDNISRVELILPDVSADPRISLTLKSSGGTLTQDWLLDDSGRVYRSGRGIVAIDVMKHMLRGNELTLASRADAIDGLRFDTSNLAEVIAPMRGACRW